MSTDFMRGTDDQGDFIRCCICFAIHHAPFDGLVRDGDGVIWDVCVGDCAADAGIKEHNHARTDDGPEPVGAEHDALYPDCPLTKRNGHQWL